MISTESERYFQNSKLDNKKLQIIEDLLEDDYEVHPSVIFDDFNIYDLSKDELEVVFTIRKIKALSLDDYYKYISEIRNDPDKEHNFEIEFNEFLHEIEINRKNYETNKKNRDIEFFELCREVTTVH